MDKYEYKVRAEEIKELINQGEYAQAVEIADTIDWRRVRNVKMLCIVSDLYKVNRRYEDARDLMLLAYECRPGGRNICYALCELSIKTEDVVHAIEYYKEFVQVAPKDPGRFILQYKLYEAQDVSLEERIEVLEELKRRDYSEKWAYELAYLYHRVGLATRCVEECDELITMIGEGKYVIKAMELKMLHQPLTQEQQERYDHRFDEWTAAAQQPEENSSDQQETDISGYAEEGALSEGVSDVISDTVLYESVHAASGDGTEAASEPPAPEAPAQGTDELDIQVKTVDVGEYNTINLQAEIAEGLKEVLEEKPLEAGTEEIEEEEVFFGETGEISDLPLEAVPDKTGEIVMQQMRMEMAGGDTAELLKVEPPREMAHVLAQESDGQISFVVPENQRVEKQITGQLKIQDILAEWERMKQENEEERREKVRQHVLQQTGRMFTEFDAAARDGLLEQLEKNADKEIEQEAEAEAEAETFESEFEAPAGTEEPQEAAEEPEASGEAVEETEEAEAPEETAEAEEAEEPEEPAEEAAEELGEVAEETSEAAEETEEPEASGEAIEEAAEPEEPAEASETAVASSGESEEPEPSRAGNVRPMTQEEQEIYAPFIQSRSARDQIVTAVDNISLAAYTGNVIITGEEGMDTLSLAKNMVKEAQAADSNFSGKIAKISGRALNRKDVGEIVKSLQNGALIIQKASGMEGRTAQELYRILQQENLGIVVVMEDGRKAMNSFLGENEQLLTVFTVRVDVEAMNNDTLVAFGKQYAHEKEYSIDELGILALHTRIEERQTIDHAVTAPEVKEIVDGAIHHANRKNMQHFFDILLFKRYDEEDMIILTEKDFA